LVARERAVTINREEKTNTPFFISANVHRRRRYACCYVYEEMPYAHMMIHIDAVATFTPPIDDDDADGAITLTHTILLSPLHDTLL